MKRDDRELLPFALDAALAGLTLTIVVSVLFEWPWVQVGLLSTSCFVLYMASRRLRSEHGLAMSRLAVQGMALDSAANAVFVTDPEGVIEYVNPAFERITGYASDEVVGSTPRLLRSGQQDREFYQRLWETISSGRTWTGEVVNRRKDGTLYHVSETITPVRGRQHRISRFVAIQEDITERKQAEAKVVYQAFHDSLTGLPNRALFLRRLEQELAVAEREKGLISLLFFDLDRFKEVNDALGHHIGDQLLISVAERVESLLRRGDTLARLGGDEFAVLLSGTPLHSHYPGALAHRLCEALVQPFRIGASDVYSSGSVGIALGPQDGATANDLLQAADLAMYRAKDRGRNTFEFFSPDIQALAVERQRMGRELHAALQAGELRVFYQPQLHMASGRLVGFEALVRWEHPERGLLGPNQFITLAEESGQIGELGRWVLDESVRQLAEWDKAGIRVPRVAVNVSISQFLANNLPGVVREVLQRHAVEPARLELEITESVLIRDHHGVARQMRELAELGVKFALDDFGTGYSSLAVIQDYPVHTLKIAQQFAPENDRSAAIVSTVAAMARALGLGLVAEGVETERHAEVLSEVGCTVGQGFLYSRAVPPDQAMEIARGTLGN